MATLWTDKNGRYLAQFSWPARQRRTISLGYDKVFADDAKRRIEELIVARKYRRSLGGGLAEWLARIDDRLHAQLAKAGLDEPREPAQSLTHPLGKFIDEYIASRVDAKPNTITVFNRVRTHLVNHFGENKPVESITEGDADGWRLYLIGKKLADNTVRRHCGIAKQFFKVAVRRKWITTNPFADLVSIVRGSSQDRQYFVTRQEIAAILEHCPDTEWKTMVALSRFGGLRCPSEVLALRWCDVDFDRMRIKVRSPKTEHHEGHESRIIPLFPELEPILLQLQNEAPTGSEFVITRYRDPACNLRTQFERIIDKAKLKAWPKLWHNMRASRQTELAKDHPIHVVCAWIGNSRAIAQEHYLQVRDEDFDLATRTALQKCMQQGGEPERTPSEAVPDSPPSNRKYLYSQGFMGVTGLEPVTSRV